VPLLLFLDVYEAGDNGESPEVSPNNSPVLYPEYSSRVDSEDPDSSGALFPIAESVDIDMDENVFSNDFSNPSMLCDVIEKRKVSEKYIHRKNRYYISDTSQKTIDKKRSAREDKT